MYHASVGFLPHLARELEAKLAETPDVKRYAIVTPGLSFTLGGAVISVDAAGTDAPQGEHWELPYQSATPQGPAAFGTLTPQGTGQSLVPRRST